MGCLLSPPDASGSTPDLHKYRYDLSNCYPDDASVGGEYDVLRQTAHEEYVSVYNYTGTLVSDWFCPAGDPWFGPTQCKNTSPGTSAGSEEPNLLSTRHINDADYATIRAALNVVLARLAAQKAAALAAVEVTSVTAGGPGCRAACYGLGSSNPATEVTSTTASGSGCGAACYGLGSIPAPAPIAYHDPSIGADGWPQLDVRTQGEAVKSLQYLLQGQGQALAILGVDGKFNPETSAAVLAFQKATPGVDTDGIVRGYTWLALIVTVQQGSQGAAVKAVQSQLKLRGLLAAAVAVDGNFGPSGGQTDVAVRAYQKSLGLVADGQGVVGTHTWPALLVGR